MDQHIQNSSAHIAPLNTPLDVFFQSFHGFDYDRELSPSQLFTQLQRFNGWRRHNPTEKAAWALYQSALEEEVKLWFGAEDDLGSWHSLCRALEIKPLPMTCAQGVKSVRGVFVNIIDLLEWARSDKKQIRVRMFPSLAELRDYTKRTGKIFHNKLGSDDNENVVLRHLLRFIF
ncbi:hypothetical protein N7457_009881 [Penicillium paradoxum]|uniref:uncharacterized protein n=1 Tax=Penicillium paradoxum TaxID=176176 RepID=UPI0025494794|nr:uncharacterized protein N7457_009881 [Penicillium paradoxum]KAJ5774985.1 hypothetical protein N7457_009881 [Penicillium paradoxum]